MSRSDLLQYCTRCTDFATFLFCIVTKQARLLLEESIVLVHVLASIKGKEERMLACLYCRTFEFRKKQAKQRDDDDVHTHLPNCILYLAHVIGIELAANLKLYLCLVKNSARSIGFRCFTHTALFLTLIYPM